jgi:DNA-directed RNA polymerase specialized sigma24 family protein
MRSGRQRTPSGDQILAVGKALEKFARLDPKRAEQVKLRYFVGLTFAAAAEVLGIAETTAKRQWAFARAWWYEEIRGKSG